MLLGTTSLLRHRPKLGTVLCALALLVAPSGCREAIDPENCVILTYEVDLEKAPRPDQEEAVTGLSDEMMGHLVAALERRLNPSGRGPVAVRGLDATRVELTIGNKGAVETRRIKDLIESCGTLEFRIVARHGTHDVLIKLADEQEGKPVVRDEAGKVRGKWIGVARSDPEDGDTAEAGEYKVDVSSCKTRDRDGKLEVLVEVDPFDIRGEHLRSTSLDFDEMGQPCVSFNMTESGAKRLRALTSDNLPDPQAGIYYWLGIVLDDELLSAPRIQSTIADRGRITGNFTQDEVDFIASILRAGRLPVPLKSDPVSEVMRSTSG